MIVPELQPNPSVAPGAVHLTVCPLAPCPHPVSLDPMLILVVAVVPALEYQFSRLVHQLETHHQTGRMAGLVALRAVLEVLASIALEVVDHNSHFHCDFLILQKTLFRSLLETSHQWD